ncbi:MAG: sugar ABC transporter ATP-binding protein [Verrucomicrobia bacterium]|nr:sugar ABC transporter ATP-binding protein [Verrucomicrobiota bacterium]MDA1065744.1 sugar ABC transporter ATP-binding protein [Verrucomicrobiota bacterium]
MPELVTPTPHILLQVKQLSKSFPGVRALDKVSLELAAGEVLAMVGENGAGKSTLIKILGGAHPADSGDFRIHGNSTVIASPADAQLQGISIIYQEFNLIPDLSVRENIYLGREDRAAFFIDEKKEKEGVELLFNQLGLNLDSETSCRELSIAEQQLVEIAKALSLDAKILVMDEPSATLTQQEVDRLFKIIRDLKEKGIGIIYISHRLEEVFEIGDRVMVLRDGQNVVTKPVSEVDRSKLIEWMVGRSLESEFPPKTSQVGEECLRVESLSRGNVVSDVSFSLRTGEILGFAGLVGAGRTETMRLIFGADRKDSGEIFLNGKSVTISSPQDAIDKGICLLTEDRKNQGLVLVHSVLENFGLPNLADYSGSLFLDETTEREHFKKFQSDIQIKVSNADQEVGQLSGGNQQKVVLAKWLERNADILIFDEPTRGIDVGAKYEIYQLMNSLAEAGKGIIMISSELPEVLGMSDRIIVMRDGRIQGELNDVSQASQEAVMQLAVE